MFDSSKFLLFLKKKCFKIFKPKIEYSLNSLVFMNFFILLLAFGVLTKPTQFGDGL